MIARFTDEYLTWAIHQLRIGRKSHMPGIRRYPDCKTYYPDDYTGIIWCRDCREHHDRLCIHCRTRFSGDLDGNRLCQSCRSQHALF
ncbi:hypothetical protein [Qaidamihabitans albus]|uniref:hypothetical protein n=1 Tax=Qaidamihabitans albus TaxID=2795733 RepID=UPI0018F1C861|nr:hypothetical protein [Qaidamihabitans albus]